MKLDVFDLEGKKKKSIELPSQFDESYEPNIVKRAVLAFISKLRQPYGTNPRAGFRQSAKISRRRKSYKTAYGKGISRVPRKVMWRRGMQFGWVGTEAPGTVGGRRAHPPHGFKSWLREINHTENSKAIRSALGGLVGEKKVYVIVDDFEKLKKTKEVKSTLIKLGFEEELERLKVKKVRAGRGKSRGRKYITKVGPLVIISKESDVCKGARNLTGFDVVNVNALNINLLTRGHEELRQTIWTESAISALEKQNLFRGKK